MATPTSLPASFSAGSVLTAAQMNNLRGSFRVLQLVTASTTTSVSNSTTTFADVGLSATITPQATTNKILVMTFNACQKTDGNAANGVWLRLFRGATNIGDYTYGLWTNTALNNIGSLELVVYDNPATTSAVTYKIQMRNGAAAAAAVYSTQSNPSIMVLMEISE